MKRKGCLFRVAGSAAIAIICAAVSSRALLAQTGAEPAITSVRIERTELVVSARIPTGLKRVVLQSRARVLGSAWIPRAVTRLDGAGGDVTFRIPVSERYEFIRVQAAISDPLPASYYQGTNQFNGEISLSPVDGVPPGRALGGGLDGAPGAGNEEPRTVVESDIWKIEGGHLYFFNQFRGLQIVDLSNSDVPVLQGTFALPAAGEQMYLTSDHAVLLARNACGYNESEASRVIIVNVADPSSPTLGTSLPVPGYISESRMVGTALYVASQTYRTRIENGVTIWEWGTAVSSFDLSNPSLPVAKGTLWFSGYGNTVAATDRYLFVASNRQDDYWRSNVQIVDISSPSGEMKALSTVVPAGQVNDKFKINVTGDTLTLISLRWEQNRGWLTWLETFSLSDPEKPTALGQLRLGQGEQLHATRFDGNKVYIVTFYRVDPLWIVDLSNPARPTIAGELEVPGWSTYIYPWGDRLVTIGIDPAGGWRVAVSLFDVHDPAKPALLDKELLGQNYSWSEATYDEKAFNVLPDAGLILLPYSGNVSSNGWAQEVQLIDLARNSLTLRGSISHQFQPRRATFSRDHILSLSARELLSVDASDRDDPIVKSNLELSWSADRLFTSGNHIVEIENGSSWWWYIAESPTILRVAAKSDPERILRTVSLPEKLPVTGADLRGGYLYTIQSRSFYEYPVVLGGNGQSEITTNPPALIMTVFDVRNLPELRVVGSVTRASTNNLWGNFDPIWLNTNVLVWTGDSGGYWWWWRNPVLADARAESARTMTAQSIVSRPGYWNPSGNGRLFAFDVQNPGQPRLLSDLSLDTTNHWNFSPALHQGSLIYLSDQSWEQLTTSGTSNQWVSRYFLHVIDYSDPELPAPRRPVNIPGSLKGLSHDGTIIYTGGPHWNEKGATDWSEWIDASAYDEIEVRLLDSLPVGGQWTSPYVISDGNVYLASPAAISTTNSLALFRLSSEGRFKEEARVNTDFTASTLAAINDLLVVRDNFGGITLFDAGVDTPLRKLGQSTDQGCLWPDLATIQGDQAEGLWLPLGEYGVSHITVKP